MTCRKVTFSLLESVHVLLISCFALVPLIDDLSLLWTLEGWKQLMNFHLSNMDIFLVTWMKLLLLATLITATPTSGYKATPSHKKHQDFIGWLSAGCQALFVAKAAVVAVLAPDMVFPTPGKDGDAPFVGLLYMYCSICLAIVATAFESWLAKGLIRERERLHQACLKVAESISGGQESCLTAPLLAAKSVTATATYGKEKGGSKEKTKINKDTVKELLLLSLKYWQIITVAFSAGALAALANAGIPYLSGQIIDYASIDPDRSKFFATTIKLVICSLLCAIFSGIRGGLFSLAMAKLNVRIRLMLFNSLLNMEIGFFDTNKSGDITSRLNADTTTVSSQVCLNVNVLMRCATQAAMVLAFMFWSSWRLTVVTFILVPLILGISDVYGKYVSEISKKVQSELADANGVAQEMLGSMPTVKAHAAEASSEIIYASMLEKFYKLKVKEALAYSAYAVLTTFLPNVVADVVLFYGGCLVLDNKMSPGALVSFMLYHQSLSSAFTVMGDVYSSLTSAVGAADKVIELIKRKPEIAEKGTLTLPKDELKGEIELRNVVFSYPARPHLRVLDNLSLFVKAGEVVALVGASGGGKSSIVKLLERYYLPTTGSVLVDGRDVGSYDAKWLRRQMALVSQEPCLYARSIKRNIVFGLEKEDGMDRAPTQEDVEEAAKQANAHSFITTFPDGYDTDCGEKGVQMSGGQKQRIAIARALVRKPRVLLLDEATSALDADSEAVVQEALDRMMSGRTTLVIAHRLSTIQGADRIIVIGKGGVQESGTHAELLGAGGAYANLVHRQLTRSQSSTLSLTNLGASSSQDLSKLAKR